MAYQVQFTAEAAETLKNVADRRIRRQILQRAANLSQEPEKQGRALTGKLSGYRSIRAVGQRYRVVYRIDQDQVRVIVVAAGLRRSGDRRDIYALAQRLVQLGLVQPPEEGEGS